MSEPHIEILEPGIQSLVQDYPGRRGMLRQGFFPSGAMDYVALETANLLVGNPTSAAGIEIALGNFSARIAADTVIAVCGAEVELLLDGQSLPLWESHAVSAGAVLTLGIAATTGFRIYVAVAGGIDVPEVFGSRATYTMGALGGLDGRALRSGDRVPLGDTAGGRAGRRFREDARPVYGREWEIEAVVGPQAAPDYMTEADVVELFSHRWKVDRNADRTGIRLESYPFTWARSSGGVAGGHPSNILDNPYPVGAVNINGDLPVILGPDGPTAGGFVVAATVVHGAFWKLGQLRPGGDHLRFRQVTVQEAARLEQEWHERLSEAYIEAG
ncbi:MAG: biotin-dependent carboxyltransferase family protein [Actinomycetota bacterium]|nr:biotin-dependent carboxyltransferase family protein [Actinomycetota bacterium]